MDFDFSVISQQLLTWAPKLLRAILVLIIGFWIVGIISRMIGKAMDNAGLDRDVQPFLKSLVSVLLKVLVVISAAG